MKHNRKRKQIIINTLFSQEINDVHFKNIDFLNSTDLINELRDFTEFECNLLKLMHHVNPDNRICSENLKDYFYKNKIDIKYKRPQTPYLKFN